MGILNTSVKLSSNAAVSVFFSIKRYFVTVISKQNIHFGTEEMRNWLMVHIF